MFGRASEAVGIFLFFFIYFGFQFSCRYKAGIPAQLPSTLIPQLKVYVTTNDISLLAQALLIIALLLELSPSTTFPEVERDILKNIYAIAHSPLISGVPFESVLAFFAALVEADQQIAAHIVPNLVISVEKAQKAEASPANVAKCVGQVVKSQQSIAAGTIAEFAKHLKVGSSPWVANLGDNSTRTPQPASKAKSSQVVLSLLVMGEVGRFMLVFLCSALCLI